ncbi:MAG: site-specific integrase [Solirubrobacteraceae bacterium]
MPLVVSAGRGPCPAFIAVGHRATRASVPREPTDRGGDRRGDALRGRSAVWPAIANAGRAALASRAADQRSAQPRRERSGPSPRQRPRPLRKGGKRREVGMDQWAWQHLNAWVQIRVGLRVGALLCVIDGPTQGRPWSPTTARATLRELAVTAGVRRRFAPHQLRHAHAVEMAREDVPLNVIQRQLGHANLGISSIYLQGIDSSGIIDTVYRRADPMLPASAGLH